MPHTPFSDEDIIRCLLSGDRQQKDEAVKYLWEKYWGWVKKRVDNYGGKPSDLASVLHEATVALVFNFHQGKYDSAQSAVGTYFCAIAKNVLLKILRERGKGRLVPLSELPPDFPIMADDDIEKTLESKEIEEKVIAVIKQLDETCQQVLTLFYLDGKPLQEIAETLGLSENAAKKRRQRCAEQARKWIDDDFKNWYNDK